MRQARFKWISKLVFVTLGALFQTGVLHAQDKLPPRELRVVGSLAQLSLYTQFEEPFWTKEFPSLTQGEYKVNIAPFDQIGIRGQDMLRLLQVGTVPMGTALISQVAVVEPRLGLLTLAGMTPTSSGLRDALQVFRHQMERILREQYGIEPLAVYIYPAQMLFCRSMIDGFAGLKGRKVRVSSPTQSDLMTALGAIAVQVPLNELTSTLRAGRVDCAITGTLSGHEIGLDQVSSHILDIPINWGGAFFGVNMHVWQGFSQHLQSDLRKALTQLERRVWAEETRKTQEGIDCLAGRPACKLSRKGNMLVVSATAADRQLLRKTFAEHVLPKWIQRCATDCHTLWNSGLAAAVGVQAKGPKR
jgi:TRAP-type C4-dicarboxylate transport system substrate-binding protein